jgi:hypothetical protein
MAKHENYELLNLIGYGMAKFDDFVSIMGYTANEALYDYLVSLGVAETKSVIKNRRDLFDPFFDNSRKGWWQKGDAYIHRKHLIDLFYGDLTVIQYVDFVKKRLHEDFHAEALIYKSMPLLDTRFRQMQETGRAAEEYFRYNYQRIDIFKSGQLEDARLYGDGYDFQILVEDHFYLAEVKGIKEKAGSIRLTENEYLKAKEYKSDYILAIVANLSDIPELTIYRDPLEKFNFEQTELLSKAQITYNAKIKL